MENAASVLVIKSRVMCVQVSVIVKALHRQLKEKSIKSRQGYFCLLTELAHTVPGALEQHIPALIPGTQEFLFSFLMCICLSFPSLSSLFLVSLPPSFRYSLLSDRQVHLFHHEDRCSHLLPCSPPLSPSSGLSATHAGSWNFSLWFVFAYLQGDVNTMLVVCFHVVHLFEFLFPDWCCVCRCCSLRSWPV